ncbi:hypothetical protein [Paenibacillus alvei]|uniref:hypothetical protein n=1 Tax=Paenibacillus alvei TaxID=44250 RepID=UPI00227ECBEC|nr:hypothetical protein [Paenibacillus alvei]
MKKSYLLIGLIAIIIIVVFVTNRETYDESIHDNQINKLVNDFAFKQFFKRDSNNKFGYDISIFKSEEKEQLPYKVSDKKYYSYTIFINVTEEFYHFRKGNQFDILDDITDVFTDKIVGDGTNYEGYYDKVILNYRDTQGFSDSWRMNVNGFPKLLGGKTRKEYTLMYYDTENNNKPVYEEDMFGK